MHTKGPSIGLANYTFIQRGNSIIFNRPYKEDRRRLAVLLAIEKLRKIGDRESAKLGESRGISSPRAFGYIVDKDIPDHVTIHVEFIDENGDTRWAGMSEYTRYDALFYSTLDRWLNVLINFVT